MASLPFEASAGLEELCRRYLEAQLAGNRREALRLVLFDGLERGHSVRALQCRVVQAAQRRIGSLWAQNRISIAQEHMATAISQVVMSRLFDEAELPQRNGKKVVVACVEGELHEFPARLVSDFLEMGGFEVRYLGASVPTHDLLMMLGEERPDLACLSVTMSFNVAALRKAAGRIRAVYPELPILVGGHALEWEPQLAEGLDVHGSEGDAEQVVQTARRLTGLAQ